MADFTLTGNIVKADTVDSFSESSNQSGREVVIEGLVGSGRPLFEATLRIQRESSPSFDPLGQVSLGQQVTMEVTIS